MCGHRTIQDVGQIETINLHTFYSQCDTILHMPSDHTKNAAVIRGVWTTLLITKNI